ncbi:MAG TPA: alpha/beta hydrolase domain-containing protein [Pseudonocardiaceae bacterium]
MTGPITGGRFGIPFSSSPVPLGPADYTEQEYFLSGTATGYQQAGTWGSDGRWSVTPAEQAPYETRILVRRPADPARFNGTVVVEWLNVTTGVDLDADYFYDNAELLRDGYAWVGVSAQSAGVNSLRAIDPTRYGGLNHPGDTFSYSIFSQAARSLLNPTGVAPLGGLRPKALIADGESQSALRMTTYANAIQPVDHLFNGFLIHSRSANAAQISQAPQVPQASPAVADDRTDLGVPVLAVETETDLFGAPLFYQQLSQADSARFRLWELAGSSHVDAGWLTLAHAEVARYLPLPPSSCALPANSDNENYLMDDALAQLNRWVRVGVPMVSAPRIEVDGSTIVRDGDGNAVGGVRSPIVQAPTAAHSGTGNNGPSLECQLNGTMTPFSPAQLSAHYPTHAAYVAAVGIAALGDVARGYLLPVDAAEIVETAGSAPVPA